MKPTPLTDEAITRAYCKISDDRCGGKEWAIGGLLDAAPFARAIEDAVTKKWQEMLSEQEPVAWMAKSKIGGTESLIRARLLERIGRNDDHDYLPLVYASPQPAPEKHHIPDAGKMVAQPAQPAQQEPRHCACLFDESGCVEPCKLHGRHTELLRQALSCIVTSTEYQIGNPAFEQCECAIKEALNVKG